MNQEKKLQVYCDKKLLDYEIIEGNLVVDKKTYKILDDEVVLFDEDFDFIPDTIPGVLDDGVDGWVYEFCGRWYLQISEEEVTMKELKYVGKAKQKIPMDAFLGVHSGHELLNGVGLYKDWVDKAKFLGIKSLGICERHTLSGVIGFQNACKKAGIKPIFGMSVSVQGRATYDLKIYVKNFQGWLNLLSLSEIINVEEKLCIPEEIILKKLDGLIPVIDPKTTPFEYRPAIDACYQLDTVVFDNEEIDVEYVDNLEKYIKSDMDPICIYDAYYLEQEDWAAREILWGIAKKYDFKTQNQYFKNSDQYAKELITMFDKNNKSWIQLYKTGMANLNKLVDQCNFEYDTVNRRLPKYVMTPYEAAKFSSKEELFIHLIKKGFNDRKIQNPEKYLARLKEEVRVLKRGDVLDYFLVLYDIIQFAKRENILVGIGRGSAGGSLVSYLMGIIQIDPLEFDLLFERFLNDGRMGYMVPCKAYEINGHLSFNEGSILRIKRGSKEEVVFIEDLRVGDEVVKPEIIDVSSIKETEGEKLIDGTLPDIDTDFEGKARAKVKAYMEKRFGREQVCSVGSFVTMQLKGALKDMDRIFDGDFSQANLMTSIINNKDTTMLDLYKRSASEPKLKQYIKEQSDMFKIMPAILEQPRQRSIHPCAMIIFPDTMSSAEWCPVRKQKGLIVSEWDGYEMDDAGFLKEDVLGIKQLDKFADILKLIKQNGKEVPDIYNLPYDREVYRYFSNGWNGDVFQLGSTGLTEYTKQLKPQSMYDLIAAVAIFRPGPMENHYHEIYVKCKNEGRKPTFLWGTEKITKDTYGLLIYQEQIMQVCQELGGLTMKEADDVRRAMGKKKLDVLAAWKDRVKKGFMDKGCPESEFDHVWDVMIEFAKYSFNKSHSAAYAATGYVSQYLKVHYPLEYWTVALDYADEKNTLRFLSEISQTRKVSILPPDINGSGIEMASDMESQNIFWGLGSIKGIGEDTAMQIINERRKNGEFRSFSEFFNRHNFKGSKVKKQTYEALISAGAFDRLYGVKNEQKERHQLIKRFRAAKKVRLSNPKRDPYTIGTLDKNWWWLLKQKELTGLAFVDYQRIASENGIERPMATVSELSNKQIKGVFRSFGGYVIECKISKSKRGKFARLTIEHNYKLYKIVIWSDEYERFKEELKGCEKSLMVFTADLRYEAKWTKGNQFVFSEDSVLKILH